MTDLDEYLNAIRAGDADAFGLWLARAEPPLRSALREFARTVDTEAVTQETALMIWNLARAGRVTRDGKGNSLLRLAHRIARNRAIDMDRKHRREQYGAGPGNTASPVVDPGGRSIRSELGVPDDLADPGRGRGGKISGHGDPAPEGDAPGSASKPSGGSSSVDDLPDPRYDFTDPFLRERIRECFGKLKGRLRSTLSAFVNDAGLMTIAQMARKAGSQADAFRQNLARARKAMAACLKANGVEIG